MFLESSEFESIPEDRSYVVEMVSGRMTGRRGVGFEQSDGSWFVRYRPGDQFWHVDGACVKRLYAVSEVLATLRPAEQSRGPEVPAD